MKKRKLKSFVVPLMYVASIAMLLGSVYFIEQLVGNAVLKSNEIEEVDDGHKKIVSVMDGSGFCPRLIDIDGNLYTDCAK